MTAPTLRRFTDAGLRSWRDYLAEAKADGSAAPPLHLLTDPRLSEAVADAATPDRRFHSRREAADFLTELLAGLPESRVEKDAGLWGWLTLRYFDSVAPPEGGRDVLNAYRYDFEVDNPRHWYRHLLFIGWHAKRTAGGHDRLFLDGPVASLDGPTEKTFASLSLVRIPAAFEVLDRLYWDDRRHRPRKGIVNKAVDSKPGDLNNRLPRRLDQLELTYDLASLDADGLIRLLGEEFSQFDHGGGGGLDFDGEASALPAAAVRPARPSKAVAAAG